MTFNPIPFTTSSNRLHHRVRSVLTVLLIVVALAAPGWGEPSPAGSRPNIVLVVADDLGFSDLGCYGGEIDTPNLDRLADEGVRFSQFYNAARCCPSRASLMTGLYPSRAGVGHMAADLGLPGYRGELSGDQPTVAELLQDVGYSTYMVGKWHLVNSANTKPEGDRANWPNQRGFDRFYGTMAGSTSFWDPITLVEDNELIRATGDYFLTEALTRKAVEYIDDAATRDRPFFMYAAYTAPHYPLHARPEYIAKYDSRFDAGWDQLRKKRLERLMEMEMLPPGTALPPRDDMSVPWEEDPHREWQAHRMAVYAAMVDQMDVGIGEIVDALRRQGELDNTLFLFLSDNGGSAEGHLQGLIERTGQPWRDPAALPLTRDGRPVVAGDFFNRPLGPADTFGSYGARWANVSNTPFRMFKMWTHEGGIATPLIAHWPAAIKAQGTITPEIGHIVDIMATCLDLAGAEYSGPAPLDGRSLLPALKGGTREPVPLFWEHEGNRAVRLGPWKIVSAYPGDWQTLRRYPKQGRWELYDLANDRTELHDLAAVHPDKVIKLSALYESWAAGAGVVPWSELSSPRP